MVEPVDVGESASGAPSVTGTPINWMPEPGGFWMNSLPLVASSVYCVVGPMGAVRSRP